MIVLSFKSKKDKQHLYEKAKKMEEYASMIVDCLEEAGYDDDSYEEESYRRMYRHEGEHYPEHYPEYKEASRYGYRRMK